MWSLKPILFTLFGKYAKEQDTYKDVNDKGIWERYQEALGEEFDTDLLPLVQSLVPNTVDPDTFLWKFVEHYEFSIGSPVFIEDTEAMRRNLIEFNNTITRIRGTIKSFELLFGLLGLTSVAVSEIAFTDGFDSDLTLDDPFRTFDQSGCNACRYYSIVLTGGTAIDDSLKTLLLGVYNYLNPVNAKANPFTYNGYSVFLALITPPDIDSLVMWSGRQGYTEHMYSNSTVSWFTPTMNFASVTEYTFKMKFVYDGINPNNLEGLFGTNNFPNRYSGASFVLPDLKILFGIYYALDSVLSRGDSNTIQVGQAYEVVQSMRISGGVLYMACFVNGVKKGTTASAAMAQTNFQFFNQAYIGRRGNAGRELSGIIEYVDIYNDYVDNAAALASGLNNLMYSFKGVNEFDDDIGGLGSTTTNQGPEEKQIVFENLSLDGNDFLFNSQVAVPAVDQIFDLTNGRRGMRFPAPGNVKTLVFALRVSSAATNRTLFTLNVADILLQSSKIVASAFDEVYVDGVLDGSLSDNTWHVIEINSTTDVNLTSVVVPNNVTAMMSGLCAFSAELSDTQYDELRLYFNRQYGI